MLFLALTVISSSLITIVMRFSEGRIKAKTSMLSVNYLTCMILAAAHTGLGNIFPKSDGMSLTLMLGIANGALYLISLIMNQRSIEKNGVVLSSVFFSMGGLLVPLIASLCFFGETPSWAQAIGAVLSLIAIFMINYDGEKGMGTEKSMATAKGLLLLLLVTEGITSTMSKVFEEVGAAELSDNFLIFTFTSAFIFSIIMVIAKKEKPGLMELLFGVLIGVPNFFASRFMLKALEAIPAVIVYPTRSVMAIVIVTLAGLIFFGERLKKKQWAAMAVILLSVVLLNI